MGIIDNNIIIGLGASLFAILVLSKVVESEQDAIEARRKKEQEKDKPKDIFHPENYGM